VDRLVSALAGATDVATITRLLLDEAVGALGADHASVCLVTEDRHSVDIVATAGYPEDVTGHWARFSISDDLPASEAIRLGRPIMIRTRAERDTRYPVFRGTPVLTDPAFVCVPFVTAGPPARGCLVVNFAQSRSFTGHDLRVLQEMCTRTAEALARIDRMSLAD
jgi:GAF domain-containing protein